MSRLVAVTFVPIFAARTKFVLDSTVEVRLSGGRFRKAPTPPSVSARAMTDPPWRMPPYVHRRSSTISEPTTSSGEAFSIRIPRCPGRSVARA
jgi:hypothetical protein